MDEPLLEHVLNASTREHLVGKTDLRGTVLRVRQVPHERTDERRFIPTEKRTQRWIGLDQTTAQVGDRESNGGAPKDLGECVFIQALPSHPRTLFLVGKKHQIAQECTQRTWLSVSGDPDGRIEPQPSIMEPVEDLLGGRGNHRCIVAHVQPAGRSGVERGTGRCTVGPREVCRRAGSIDTRALRHRGASSSGTCRAARGGTFPPARLSVSGRPDIV